jgi:hypothetical protein
MHFNILKRIWSGSHLIKRIDTLSEKFMSKLRGC